MTRRPPSWTDGERQQLLDYLAAGTKYRQVAALLGRSDDECRAEAARLRASGWSAAGALRRSPGARQAHGDKRPCATCREAFTPPSPFIFRCERCRKASRKVAA